MKSSSLILGMMAATPALADLPTLADLHSDAALASAFATATERRDPPRWLVEGDVTHTPGQLVGFDEREFVAMWGCQSDNCAASQAALLYDPEAGEIFGLIATTGEDDHRQMLEWLNIGGGAESIDGRTILFAAISGSLSNHPDAFDYREKPADQPAE